MGQDIQGAGLARALSPARFAPYLAAGGDAARGEELYRWNERLSGVWHVHLGYVEVCLRQAMDRELRQWNGAQPARTGLSFTTDWTRPLGAAPALHSLIGQGLDKAREAAAKDASLRPAGHPRHGMLPTQDDIVAQLMFGAWARLLLLPGRPHPTLVQKTLWEGCLSRAFPRATPDVNGLLRIGRQVEGLRRLRNRIAHHENLLSVDTAARLNGSLTLLRAIDTRLPELVMRDSQLRATEHQDPRRQWVSQL